MKSWIGVTALLVLAGCGGGGSTPHIDSASIPQATSDMSVAFKIVVPTSAGAKQRRNPTYVSASTQSATVAVTLSGSSANTPAIINCSTATSTCSGTVSAPVGSDTFVVNLYDQTNGQGNLLSTGTAMQTIVAGTQNAVNVTFNGVVASLTLSLGASVTSSTAATIPLTVNALDADGNIIVGPGVYAGASGNALTVTLANTDASGATTLSQTSITQPTSGITLAYTGAAITSIPAISASASGVTTVQAVLHGSEAFAYTGSAQSLMIPGALTSIMVDAAGAQGGKACSCVGATGNVGGEGGTVSATVPISVGTLTVVVGGAGGAATSSASGAGGFGGGAAGSAITPANGAYGGGGGVASSVSLAASSVATTLIVGAGGGGGAADCAVVDVGGSGGYPDGGNGIANNPANDRAGCPSVQAGAGDGGTQTAGGAGGASFAGSNAHLSMGSTGTAGAGGAGGSVTTCTSTIGGGGGGGGGYWGGGGGGGACGTISGGGGGGSSYYISTATNVTTTNGTQSGNGSVTITW